MEMKVENKRYICIDYPAIVKNEKKMLATLGEEEKIAKVLADENKRLELKLRPADVFCKPSYGDRIDTTRLLMKVRRRKKRAPSTGSGTTADESETTVKCEHCKRNRTISSEGGAQHCCYEYDTQILGYIDTAYKFQSLVDFQYLPCQKTENGYKSLTEDLILKGIKPKSWIDAPDTPLHITPPIFSRIDQPIEYCYRDGPKHRPGYNDPMKGQPAHLIGVARQRRPHFTIFVNFTDKSIPDSPMPEAVEKVNGKRIDKSQVEIIKQLFQERPIWSKNAIRCQPGITVGADQLKHILPSIGYYWVNGPWRALWTRFSYDPRKEPGAKHYQLVDYRVRQRSAAEKLKIHSKRSSYQYTLPTQVVRSQASAATIQQDTFTQDWSKSSESNKNQLQDSMYRFWPGVRPPCRQMFYQLSDVDEPNIQAMIRSNDGKETECTERDGWCIADYQEKCRAILIKHVQKIITAGDTTARRLQELVDSNSKRKKVKAKTDTDDKEESEETLTKSLENDEESTDGEEQAASDEEDEEGEDLEVNEMETEMLDLMDEDVPEPENMDIDENTTEDLL